MDVEPMTDQRVLAFDLAIGVTGWCVLDPGPIRLDGGHFQLPDRRTREDRAAWNRRRLQAMGTHVRGLIQRWEPGVVAYEYPDKPRAAWSGGSKGREFHAMAGLALAEGFLLAILNDIAYPPFTQRAVSTSEAKRTTTGAVDASKKQVRRMIEIRTGWRLDELQDDEVDSLAVGLAVLLTPEAAAA
jgi:Holliday junction resolvasome RuvABC endonuclease subunit